MIINTFLINKYTSYSIVIVKLYNINLAYFVSLSTIIIIILYRVSITRSYNFDKLVKKFIAIRLISFLGINSN